MEREPSTWWGYLSFFLWLLAVGAAVASIVGSLDPSGNSGVWAMPAVGGVIVMLLISGLISAGNSRWG